MKKRIFPIILSTVACSLFSILNFACGNLIIGRICAFVAGFGLAVILNSLFTDN